MMTPGDTLKRWLVVPAILILLLLAACASPGEDPVTPTQSEPLTSSIMDEDTFRLPEPTGPYGVGRTVYFFSAPERPEVYTPDEDDFREILVDVWYPAEVESGGQSGPYVNPGIATAMGYPEDLNQQFPHAVIGAPVAGGRETFPVILFNPGFTALQTDYTAFCEDLASHGYVVAGISHPYITSVTIMSDGSAAQYVQEAAFEAAWEGDDSYAAELYANWVPDTLMVMDQLAEINEADPYERLTGRLDLAGFGLIGHSFGGLTSAEICLQDERCRGAISLDGGLTQALLDEGLDVPYMYMAASDGDILNDADMMAFYEGVRAESYLLILEGTEHFNFSDGYYMLDARLPAGGQRPDRMRGTRVIEVVRTYSLAFFDRFLHGEDSPLLDGPSDDFPDVTLMVREG